MPKLDGMATLVRLRERGDATPVVMLTAHGSIPDAVAAMKLGAIDFLTKPITPQALRTVVAEVIRRNEDRPAPQPEPSAARRTAAVVRASSWPGPSVPSTAASSRRPSGCSARSSPWIPDSKEAHELLDRLLTLKEREGHGAFRILREWFPGSDPARRPAKSCRARTARNHERTTP